MSRLLVVTLLAACAALAGCGKVGALEQPAPLFGAQAKADYDAKQRAAADARVRAKAQATAEPTTPDQDPHYQALAPAADAPAAPAPAASTPVPTP